MSRLDSSVPVQRPTPRREQDLGAPEYSSRVLPSDDSVSPPPPPMEDEQPNSAIAAYILGAAGVLLLLAGVGLLIGFWMIRSQARDARLVVENDLRAKRVREAEIARQELVEFKSAFPPPEVSRDIVANAVEVDPPDSKPKPTTSGESAPPADPPSVAAEEPIDQSPKITLPKKVLPKQPIAEPKVDNPFADWPESVQLPKLGSPTNDAEPIVLLNLKPAFSEPVRISLLSDSAASGSGGRFELSDGQAPERYDVALVSRGDAESPRRETIARLHRRQHEILFQWLADDASAADAEFLRNCRLRMDAASHHHVLALRKFMPAEPLLVNFLKGGTSVQHHLTAVPQEANVILEVVDPPADFPKHAFTTGRQIAANQQTDIEIMDSLDKPILALRIGLSTAKRNRQATITVKPFVAGGKILNPRIATERILALQAQHQALDVRYKSILGRIPAGLRAQAKAEYERATKQLEQQILQLQELSEVCNKIERCSLQYRLFMKLDDDEITLLCSEGM